MGLFEDWCDTTTKTDVSKRFIRLVEKQGGRTEVLETVGETVRSHYDCLERIADDVDALGFEGAAAVLRELLPMGKRAQAGDLGEILASELVEETLDFNVPVRRMRYKDGREVAMRGDDFIGVAFCQDDNGLWLLKGEAKSRRMLAKTTISQARAALNRHDGRCTPSSLLFVANRLLDGDETQAELGRLIRNEVGQKALPEKRIDHALFTLSGNTPPQSLDDDYAALKGDRAQVVINFHVPDYDDLIASIFAEAGALGND